MGMSDGMFAVCGAYGMLELEVFCRAAALRADGSLKYEMRVLERSDSKLGRHSPFKMSDGASLFCLYCLGITLPGHSDLRVFGLLPPRRSLYGRVFGRSMGPRRFRFQLLGTRTRAVKVDMPIAVYCTYVCAAQRLAP